MCRTTVRCNSDSFSIQHMSSQWVQGNSKTSRRPLQDIRRRIEAVFGRSSNFPLPTGLLSLSRYSIAHADRGNNNCGPDGVPSIRQCWSAPPCDVVCHFDESKQSVLDFCQYILLVESNPIANFTIPPNICNDGYTIRILIC